MVIKPEISLATMTYDFSLVVKWQTKGYLTWKKSNDRPMLPNTAGSSEHKVTGTPWLMSAGKGCIGIEEVNR